LAGVQHDVDIAVGSSDAQTRSSAYLQLDLAGRQSLAHDVDDPAGYGLDSGRVEGKGGGAYAEASGRLTN
jgi:hypothetical protein